MQTKNIVLSTFLCVYYLTKLFDSIIDLENICYGRNKVGGNFGRVYITYDSQNEVFQKCIQSNTNLNIHLGVDKPILKNKTQKQHHKITIERIFIKLNKNMHFDING